MDGACAATTAAAKGTARRDDTATATAVVLADAATAHVCNPGLQAAATAPDPASPPTNVAIPTATATAVVDINPATATTSNSSRHSSANARDAYAASASNHPDGLDWPRAAARALPTQTPANARRSTGPGDGYGTLYGMSCTVNGSIALPRW